MVERSNWSDEPERERKRPGFESAFAYIFSISAQQTGLREKDVWIASIAYCQVGGRRDG